MTHFIQPGIRGWLISSTVVTIRACDAEECLHCGWEPDACTCGDDFDDFTGVPDYGARGDTAESLRRISVGRLVSDYLNYGKEYDAAEF